VKAEKKKRSVPVGSKHWIYVLRTWHIGVASVLFGGIVCSVSFFQLITLHHLAIVSGGALIVSRIFQSRHWLYQVRGIIAVTHVGLLGIVHVCPEYSMPLLTVVLILVVFAANLPGYIKQWSLLHWCRIE
jgi:hypothetical protein